MLTKEVISQLNFEKVGGLMPAIVQNAVSGRVLMLGYMNKEALQKTLQTGRVTFGHVPRQGFGPRARLPGTFSI